MSIQHITIQYTSRQQLAINNFEDAFYDSLLRYSLKQLTFGEDLSEQTIIEALQKSIQVCFMLNINSRHHFKKIYVSNSVTGTVHVDWLMSKRGFNLMIMQIPSLNERRAKWLWQLSE
jgi:hypothetical protein